MHLFLDFDYIFVVNCYITLVSYLAIKHWQRTYWIEIT